MKTGQLRNIHVNIRKLLFRHILGIFFGHIFSLVNLPHSPFSHCCNI